MDEIATLRTLTAHHFSSHREFTDEGELDAVICCGWWSSDHLDVVAVRDRNDAAIARIVGIDPRRPHDLSRARHLMRDTGSVAAMVESVLTLPSPGGVRMILRTAQTIDPVELSALLRTA